MSHLGNKYKKIIMLIYPKRDEKFSTILKRTQFQNLAKTKWVNKAKYVQFILKTKANGEIPMISRIPQIYNKVPIMLPLIIINRRPHLLLLLSQIFGLLSQPKLYILPHIVVQA